MLGVVHGDLLSRPKRELTSAERQEQERRREAVRALLREIARPAVAATDDRRAA